MAHLTVSFKLPIIAVDAVRSMAKRILQECAAKEAPSVWNALTEEQKAENNRQTYEAQLIIRLFE